MKKFLLVVAAATVLAPMTVSQAVAGANSHPLFKPHAYTGQVFGRSARASTGNPNIVVFDRRHEIGEIYQCSYITYRGKRAVVCD